MSSSTSRTAGCPYPGGQWEINSIGTFTSTHRAYLIVMLTYDNPSMEYGIDTIERAAEVIHHELNPRKLPAIAPSKPSPPGANPTSQSQATPSHLRPGFRAARQFADCVGGTCCCPATASAPHWRVSGLPWTSGF